MLVEEIGFAKKTLEGAVKEVGLGVEKRNHATNKCLRHFLLFTLAQVEFEALCKACDIKTEEKVSVKMTRA
jgi:hypothetical protein